MPHETTIKRFLSDWFGRFDRLEPIEVFLPDLHPDVVWDMEGIDENLHGHARVKAWYAGILAQLKTPTEHHLSQIEVDTDTVQFEVLFAAETKEGIKIGGRVKEHWRFETRADGRLLITHYKATPLDDVAPANSPLTDTPTIENAS